MDKSNFIIEKAKHIRNNKKLASTYLLEPQLEGNQVENFHPLFAFFLSWGELLAQAN